MKAKLSSVLLALAFALVLGGCSDGRLTEGKVKYVRYQLADQDVRYISALPKEMDADKGSASIERYESDPFVRVWPGYLEISYTSRTEGKEPERITHLISRERLINLRWLNPRD